MYPELFHIGPIPFLHLGQITVYSFGVMAGLALVLGCTTAWLLMRRFGLPFEYVYELVFLAGIGGFVGARIYYLAQHWGDVKGDFWHNAFGGAGFTWYGGAAGGFLAILVWTRLRHVETGLVANACGAGLALGYAIGRIGCQLSGDGDYGKVSTLPWAMSYSHGVVPTPPGVRVQPTPIYETLVMLVVFVVLYRMARKPQPGWYVWGWFMILSGIERFLVEFVRLNPTDALGMTVPQWIGIASALVGTWIVVVTRSKPPIVAATVGTVRGDTPRGGKAVAEKGGGGKAAAQRPSSSPRRPRKKK